MSIEFTYGVDATHVDFGYLTCKVKKDDGKYSYSVPTTLEHIVKFQKFLIDEIKCHSEENYFEFIELEDNDISFIIKSKEGYCKIIIKITSSHMSKSFSFEIFINISNDDMSKALNNLKKK